MKKVKDIPEEEELKEKDTTKFNFLMLGMAIVFLALGILLVSCVPHILSLTQLCYLLSAVVMGAGVFFIVRYFMTEAYKNLQEYGFSVGVILVAAGCIAMVRSEQIQGGLLYVFGALILIAAVFKFQNALDLKALRDPHWYVWLAIAAVFAVLGILSVINPFGENEAAHASFTAVVMIMDGIMSIIGTIYLFRRIKQFLKREADPDAVELPPKDRPFFLKPGPEDTDAFGTPEIPSAPDGPSAPTIPNASAVPQPGGEANTPSEPVIIRPEDEV